MKLSVDSAEASGSAPIVTPPMASTSGSFSASSRPKHEATRKWPSAVSTVCLQSM